MSTWAERLSQRKNGKTPLSSVSTPLYAREELTPLYRRPEQTSRLLHLANDCWEWIASFLTYGDVVQLASTCFFLHCELEGRDSVWEQQLRYFHTDMLDLRGGSLLATDLAFPGTVSSPTEDMVANNASFRSGSKGRAGTRSGGALFPSSLRKLREVVSLYRLDARREWHFRDISALDADPKGDGGTKVFTMAVTLGAPVRSSDAARTAVQAAMSSDQLEQLAYLQRQQHLHQQQQQQQQQEGGTEGPPPLFVTLLRPVRRQTVHRRGLSGSTRGSSPTPPPPPPRAMTEEEEVQYVLRLSACEAGLATPPAMPYMSAPTPASSSAPLPPPDEELTVEELLTLLDHMRRSTVASSEFALDDTTEDADPLFLFALTETIRCAREHRDKRWCQVPATPSPGEPQAPQEQQQQQRHARAPRLPPARRMLNRFRGKLIEVTADEAQGVCVYLGLPGVLHDFVAFWSGRQTRFFLSPDLSGDGAVCLLVMDPVRMLVVAGEEGGGAELQRRRQQQAHDGDGEEEVPWGHGYNAQYNYEPELQW